MIGNDNCEAFFLKDMLYTMRGKPGTRMWGTDGTFAPIASLTFVR